MNIQILQQTSQAGHVPGVTDMKGGDPMSMMSEALQLRMELRAMFPFLSRITGINRRDALNAYSSILITMQEEARYILLEADTDEKLLKWIQGKYPNATISDASKERKLMENLIEAKGDSAGHNAINELSVFHRGLASRRIKHSDR